VTAEIAVTAVIVQRAATVPHVMELPAILIAVPVAIMLLVATSPVDLVVPISKLRPNCLSVPKPSV
jgi:hypothetical protein